MRYSALAILKNGLSGNRNWPPVWRKPQPKAAYDVVIIGAGHGLAAAYYLAAKHGKLEPTDLRARAQAQKWMDWQLAVASPAIFPLFWGLVRTPPEKRDPAAIAASRDKIGEALGIMEAQLAKTKWLGGDEFSYGDIPVGIMIYRYMQIIPERPATPHLDRWYAAISSRPAFKEQVAIVPLS